MKKNEYKQFQIENIELKVAKKIQRDLLKKLKKAEERTVMNYDRDAYAEFCAEVVYMMDVMIGIVKDKYETK